MWPRWQATWERSPRRGCLAKTDTKIPGHSFIEATDGLTRAQASMLMQLRTGHVLLNWFLHCIGKAESPTCPGCMSAGELVHHFLFECLVHTHAHHELAKMLGWKSKSLKHLLGSCHAFKPFLRFIQRLGRFKETHSDLFCRVNKDGPVPHACRSQCCQQQLNSY